ERLATLYRIQRGDFDVAVVPAPTALVRMCPPAYIAAHTFFLRAGETLDLERLRGQLATAGYQHVTQVVAPGEFCVRGGIIDLFPMGSALPYRLDLDDDVIDSVKTFDIDSQRTLYAVNEIRMLPAREFPLDEAGHGPLASAALPAIAVDRRAHDPLAAFKHFLAESNLKVFVAAESPGRRETMANYFAEYGLKPAALPAGVSGFDPLLQGNAAF